MKYKLFDYINGVIVGHMLGIKEWMGVSGKKILDVRNTLENYLLGNDFQFYYFGAVSKRSIYSDNSHVLGEGFLENLIQLNKISSDYILSPEGTFRVYNHILNSGELQKNKQGKVFYSQEFMRNEPDYQVKNGKTFSFWQTGFECYGYPLEEYSWLALKTTIEALSLLSINDLYFRISDKRIIESLLEELSISERRKIYSLIDNCSESPRLFQKEFICQGGNVAHL
ncbi:ATP phosphoribosyltransferase regulatory subunit [Brenneria tiliae]|uniref:ATP phosphoribosyltransferase regulatory subunit n=1 Tax=Brenneria tiliae TaxID=2914984 RepID=A0ABT0MR76_9GAMM|nr:ATP phosphoribosyltransferase regulatory subunit [Brenneria tiliae]MCL2891679.1 ATP phosphoribosyltransferase regulatory subunit [Brenneria tiliae]